MIALVFICATEISMGSFTGSTDENSRNKYSLKNFNKNFYKKASPYSLHAGFEYKGTQIISQQSTPEGVTLNSVMRFEKGNTTYIYPYKHKVSVPKFKAPVPPSFTTH
ncbi:hypothetical protein EXU57_23870 [Segetibacter sp. 3557_3]|uniref:hypothetical protein n=1 Tax=Segetibacter sp. 3557_3 TaxID=2547429 RepID=UPI0010D1FBFE|nr:hypothetical protein [Segetibacter sp. 3557_3]TDH18295.1 hypothetical protein EXU57_23870 [Segetibacter sp. 3557_3]